jgi:hypothetical protein
MYDVKPNLVIGFHGCDRAIRDQLLNKPDDILISKKPFDWLGHGMYFWENNYKHHDKILKELDCAVIEDLHQTTLSQAQSEIKENGFSDHKVFDSTRKGICGRRSNL